MEKIDKSGYVLIYCPDHPYSKPKRNGYILEHRVVMENHLKRRLNPGEVVHHIDENKQNNNIQNLLLFSSPKEHSKFHNKIRQVGFTTPVLKEIEDKKNLLLLN